jgi:hypothetical protein
VTPGQGKRVRVSMHIQGILRFKALAAAYAPGNALEGERVRMGDLDKP